MKHVILMVLAMALFLPASTIAGDDGHAGHFCFSRVDANQDDSVTPGELEAFYPDKSGLFKKIDTDQDGTISHEEYEAYGYAEE